MTDTPIASSRCLPSPDGRFVATLLPSGIHVRAVDRLDEVANVVALPADLTPAAVISFQWSPASRRLLVATSEQILVAAAVPPSEYEDGGGTPFRAVIRHPSLPVVAKPTYVAFGSSDDHVYLCSAHGIKFAVFDLRTGKTVAISNPKLFASAVVCRRGFSVRPGSRHLALLTRTGGKDWVSVHDPTSTAPVASWAPDTVDAQGLTWSPDGRWQVVWESAAQGRKVVFFTPDGHHFKTWTSGSASAAGAAALLEDAREGLPKGYTNAVASSADELLGPGARLVQFSPNSRLLAVGDSSRCIYVVDMSSIVASAQLVHPTALNPHADASPTIWQEQINWPSSTESASPRHGFIEAAQDVSPPVRGPSTGSDGATVGCSLLAFDCSSKLLVSRLEEAPSTVWVWDMQAFRLHTVLMLHASVLTAVWHSSQPQTLLITCDGDNHRGVGFVWNPLHGRPQVADFSRAHQSAPSEDHVPTGTSSGGRSGPVWLQHDGLTPSLFYSDGDEFGLATVEDGFPATAPIPWPEATPVPDLLSSAGPAWPKAQPLRLESPLELVPADVGVGDDSQLEDTFHYRRED